MATAAILTVSDTRSAGTRADTTTALMAEILDDLSDAGTNICSCYLSVRVFGEPFGMRCQATGELALPSGAFRPSR